MRGAPKSPTRRPLIWGGGSNVTEMNVVEPRLDAARVAAVAHLVGRDKLNEMLELLSRRLASLVDDDGVPLSPKAAVRLVHQSQGSAASLGFHGLHHALRELEQRFAAGDRLAIGREIGAIRQLFAAERALLDEVER